MSLSPDTRHKNDRQLTNRELGTYLDVLIPSIYAEVYGINSSLRHQVLCALHDELYYWGSLNQMKACRSLKKTGRGLQ